MPGKGTMIELERVTKIFAPVPGRPGGGTPALREVSLTIASGGVWGVVGPNGAGKTTLFGLLLGFLEPTEGAVRIDGAPPRRYLRRHGAAYLPERFRLPAEWTPRSALRALAGLEGLKGREASARADALIERFGLDGCASRRLGALSRGQYQRLGLAQALLAERPLVVLDEPTEGLDPLWRIRFRELIEELRVAGRTVLIASHDLAEVERLAESVVLLEAGRIRELIEVARPEGETLVYRLELAYPSPAVLEAFPDARPADRVAMDGEATGGAVAYHVEVGDAAELSARLAALLEGGAVIVSVTPAAEGLEDRVRRALGEEVAP